MSRTSSPLTDLEVQDDEPLTDDAVSMDGSRHDEEVHDEEVLIDESAMVVTAQTFLASALSCPTFALGVESLHGAFMAAHVADSGAQMLQSLHLALRMLGDEVGSEFGKEAYHQRYMEQCILLRTDVAGQVKRESRHQRRKRQRDHESVRSASTSRSTMPSE